MIYYSILNIVACAIQWDLFVYLFYTLQFVSAFPKFLIYPSPIPFPFGHLKFVFYICASVSSFSWLCRVFVAAFSSSEIGCYSLAVEHEILIAVASHCRARPALGTSSSIHVAENGIVSFNKRVLINVSK